MGMEQGQLIDCGTCSSPAIPTSTEMIEVALNDFSDV